MLGNAVRSAHKHWRIIHALIIRDLVVRFGRGHLGFVWTILEPMILTAGVMFVWSMIHTPIYHDLPIVAFVLTGYMPLTLWRHTTNSMVRLIHNNANLLYHRVVSPPDIIAARMVLEFLSVTMALITVYFSLLALRVLEPMQNPGLALLAWLLTGYYHCGLGVLICAWTERWDKAEKFIQPAQYLMLPISGVFFMLSWLPSSARELLLLNPAVHCFEMFRAGYFGDGFATSYNAYYVLFWGSLVWIFGIAQMRHLRKYLELA